MSSLRRHEGYLLLDNRVSEGVSDATIAAHGLELPPGAGRGVFEAPTYTCSHCHRVVILNPDRTRVRAYCSKCDHRICDACEVVRVASGGECRPFVQVVADVQEQAARGGPVQLSHQ